jgi:hypothetical protein
MFSKIANLLPKHHLEYNMKKNHKQKTIKFADILKFTIFLNYFKLF